MWRALLYNLIFLAFLINGPATAQTDSSFSWEDGRLSVPVAAAPTHPESKIEPGNTTENIILAYGGDSYTGKTYRTTYIVGLLFCGAVGLLTFFISLLYIKSREKIYFYYVLFLLFNLLGCIINLRDFTWASQLFYQSSGLATRYLELVTLLALFAYCAFTIKLLDVRKQAPKLARWITFLAGLTALYGIVYWFIYPYIREQAMLYLIISRLIILPMSLIAIVWVVNAIQSVFKSYFIIGSIFYFTGALLGLIRDATSNIPLNLFYDITSSAYYYAGILLETICFAIALSHRIYILYQTRQKEHEIVREKAVYEKNMLQAQMLASRMQVNPHFIFNCLNAIKYLVQSMQNEKAIKYLTVFSRFIRTFLETGRKSLVSLTEEVKMAHNYLILEANRFDQNFTYAIDIDNNVETDQIFIPPMLLQPFIENAIWHNLLTSKKAVKIIKIMIQRTENTLYITIEDNGTGKSDGEMDAHEKFHKSIGSDIITERINLYNKSYAYRLQFSTEHIIDDRDNIDGTRVVLTMIKKEDVPSGVTEDVPF